MDILKKYPNPLMRRSSKIKQILLLNLCCYLYLFLAEGNVRGFSRGSCLQWESQLVGTSSWASHGAGESLQALGTHGQGKLNPIWINLNQYIKKSFTKWNIFFIFKYQLRFKTSFSNFVCLFNPNLFETYPISFPRGLLLDIWNKKVASP